MAVDRKLELENKIKTGNFTGTEAHEYNTLMGDNQGARNIMLGSQTAMLNPNVKTAVTTDEAVDMKQQGITKVIKGNVTIDSQGKTAEQLASDKKTALETKPINPVIPVSTSKPTPVTTYSNDQVPFNSKDIISTAPEFQGADGKKYKTVRMNDNSLVTIDVNSGNAVTGKYQDKDRENIRQSFLTPEGDIKKQEELKKQQDLITQNQNNLKDPENLFNSLKTGGIVDNSIKNTPEYTKTKQRFDIFTRLKNMTTTQLNGALTSGLLIPGTTTYNDLLNDPVAKQKLEDAKKENEISKGVSNLTGDVVNNTINKINGPLAEIMADNNISEEESKKLLSSPEIEEKTKEANENLVKYKELLRQNKAIEDEVDKDLSGSGATSSTRNALIYARQKANRALLEEAKDNYETSFGMLKSLKEEKVDLFKTNLGLYQASQKTIADKQVLLDKQAYDKLTLEEQRTYDEQKAKTNLENANLYKTGDINSEDSIIQNIGIENTINDMYKQYGDFAQQLEPAGVKIQRVKEMIESGDYTPAEAIQLISNEVKNSQRYKTYIKNENLKNAPKVAENWQKLDDNSLYNQVTGETKQLTGGQNQLNTISKETGETGGACGTYARVYTGIPGSLNNVVGEFKEQREKAFKDKEPVVGGLVFFNGKGYDKTYGHIAVVTGINQDGTLTITESNLKEDGKVTTRVINPYEASGYYNNTPLAKGTTTTGGGKLQDLGQYMKDNQDRGTGYSNEDVKAFNEKIDRLSKNGDEKSMSIAYRNMVMKDKDFKKNFDDTKIFITGLDGAQKLINDYEKAGKSTNALKSMAEKVARGLGISTDTALAQLQTQMGFTLASYIKSISGTAASDMEVKRLMGNMANIGNVKDLNTTIIGQVKNNSLNQLKSMIDSRMYGMPEDLKPKVFGDIYTPANGKAEVKGNLWENNNGGTGRIKK